MKAYGQTSLLKIVWPEKRIQKRIESQLKRNIGRSLKKTTRQKNKKELGTILET